MKRLLVSLVVGLGVMGLMALPASAAPKLDKVDGTGKVVIFTPFGFFPAQLHINAKSDPGGANPQGHFVSSIFFPEPPNFPPFGTLTIEGDITCLNVIGNDASDAGVVTQSSNPGVVAPGTAVIGRRIDNGQGSKATAPDMVGGAVLFGEPPRTVCNPGDVPLLFPITQGNYVVKEAAL